MWYQSGPYALGGMSTLRKVTQMTNPQRRVVQLTNETDVTLLALPGAENLPTLAVFIETDDPVYFVPDGADESPVVVGELPAEGLSRSGATVEFGVVTDVATDLSGAAVGGAVFAAGPVHLPVGSVSYPGVVLFGGHHKVTSMAG